MNIIVTGASRGIGYEIVRSFAAEKGHNILAIARNRKALNELKKKCRVDGLPSKVYVLAYDLGQPDMKESLMPRLGAYFSQVDILINNAGSLVNKPFLELTNEDFDHLFNINVRSVFTLSQMVIPMMVKGSHILNISSMGGFQGAVKFPGLALYSASKGAITILTESMAEEFREKGIAVNCLALGAVQTDMMEEAFPGFTADIDPSSMGSFIRNFAEFGQQFMNGKVVPVARSTP